MRQWSRTHPERVPCGRTGALLLSYTTKARQKRAFGYLSYNERPTVHLHSKRPTRLEFSCNTWAAGLSELADESDE